MRFGLLWTLMFLFLPTMVMGQTGLFNSPERQEKGMKSKPTISQSSKSQIMDTRSPTVGRFQLVPGQGKDDRMYLLDTATGCVWVPVENTETKRMTFVEVDVENLHWSYGSGAQQLLAERIDSANLNHKQKADLKEELRKTGCGLSSKLVLTPGRRKPAESTK